MRVLLILLCLAAPAFAEPPRVAADIAPVHGLIAQVMRGAGAPDLIVPPGASPHAFALRPSQAAAIEAADLVFHVGADLTPWLDGAVARLAPDATVIALIDTPGTVRHPVRKTPVFAAGGHDGHAQDEGHGHDHGHAHDHGGTDPHAWLDPENGKLWLFAIAAALADADPENAALYRANAAAGQAAIDAAVNDIRLQLAPARGARFIVFHDAYQYFERRFGLAVLGAISFSDAAPPGPARLAALREQVAELGADCVFSEPQFSEGLIAAVAEGTGAATAVLDPQGSELEPGPDFYPALLRDLAERIAGCL